MLRIFLWYHAMIIAQKQKNSLSNIKEIYRYGKKNCRD